MRRVEQSRVAQRGPLKSSTFSCRRSSIEGAPASDFSWISVAYDSEKVYFSGLRRSRGRRFPDASIVADPDNHDNDDTITITLEPFLDYLRGYSFAVNGYGVQNDTMIVVQNAQSTQDGATCAITTRSPIRADS